MRRAIALLTVLLVIVLGALIAMIALDQADAGATGARDSLSRRESRAVAWSGVLGALAEIETQRDDILQGAAPELTEEWTVFEDGAITARVRIEPIDAESASPVQSESAKLNLNIATVPMLARLAGLGDERASSVRGLASKGGITSVEDIRLVGLDPHDEANALGGVSLDVLATAYSLDPDLGIGIADRSSAGRPRVKWSESEKSFDRRLGADRTTTEAIEQLVGAGIDLSSATEVASALQRLGVTQSSWAGVWDEIAFGGEQGGREGLVDMSRASEAVLSCVPGFEGKAVEIHEAATRLGADRLRSPTWPLDAGIVDGAQMARALPWTTVRSCHWRVRIVGEIVRTISSSDEPKLLSRSVLEAVIDCTGERARVAYLRDVTYVGAVDGIDSILAQTIDMTRAAHENPNALPDEAERASVRPAIDNAASVERPTGGIKTPDAGSNPPARTPPTDSGARRGRWAATR